MFWFDIFAMIAGISLLIVSSPILITFLFIVYIPYKFAVHSIKNIKNSGIGIQIGVFQPEIKYLISLYNNNTSEFNVKNENRLKKSLSMAGYIEYNGGFKLTQEGIQKAIEAKQEIRRRLLQYTALSSTMAVIFFTLITNGQNNPLLYFSAFLLTIVMLLLVIFNIVSRRYLLHNS